MGRPKGSKNKSKDGVNNTPSNALGDSKELVVGINPTKPIGSSHKEKLAPGDCPIRPGGCRMFLSYCARCLCRGGGSVWGRVAGLYISSGKAVARSKDNRKEI